ILHESTLWALLDRVVGTVRTVRLFEALTIHGDLLAAKGEGLVDRKVLAQALNMLLFEDVTRRVPMAAAYVGDAVRAGDKLVFDHGALRTVACDCGSLPQGYEAFRRVLEPLGFEVRGTYPLEKLGMTGRAFAHRDLPEHIAQFFVSELHPECFTDTFQKAVLRTVGGSRDPLPLSAKGLLVEL
ncbi:MAG: DUF1338 family protein, partial [Planctomycetes bacterium]|nr:DUF1338 family protein [Planctomycetota bacterium]